MRRILFLLLLTACAARAEDGRPGTLLKLNDFGSDDVAYFAIPAQAPRGGVVVIHDSRGLVDADKDRVDRLAKEGYIAVAPDLFNGQTAPDTVRAEDLRRQLDPESAQRTIAAAVNFLRQSPRFRAARVGVAGWGMGAPLAVEAALRAEAEREPLDAVACLGGPLPEGAQDLSRLGAPVLFVTSDAASTPEARERFGKSLETLHKEAELYLLPGGSAEEEEALSWQKVLGFLTHSFSEKPKKTGLIKSTWQKLFPSKASAPQAAKAAPANG